MIKFLCLKEIIVIKSKCYKMNVKIIHQSNNKNTLKKMLYVVDFKDQLYL